MDATTTDVARGLVELQAMLARHAAPRRPTAQGDILATPVTTPSRRGQAISGTVTLIRDGNGHELTADGPARWVDPDGNDRHIIGTVILGAGSTATIRQPRGDDRHRDITLGPGAWEIRRQRAATGRRGRVAIWVAD